MSNHHVEPFVDDQLSVPGHTALVAYNHGTRARGLSCDDCAEHLGRFLPDRWLAKHLREAWEKHLPSPDEPDTRPYVADGMGRGGGADLAEIRCTPGIVGGHVGCDHDPDRMDAAPSLSEVDRG